MIPSGFRLNYFYLPLSVGQSGFACWQLFLGLNTCAAARVRCAVAIKSLLDGIYLSLSADPLSLPLSFSRFRMASTQHDSFLEP